MRRTFLFAAAFALLFTAIGGRALAGSANAPNATFQLSCPGDISASGHEAGWMGILHVEDGVGVPVPSVAFGWAFDQDTYRWETGSWVLIGQGGYDFPGVHPGAVTGCSATLWWTFLGDRYMAELTDLEVTFRGAPA